MGLVTGLLLGLGAFLVVTADPYRPRGRRLGWSPSRAAGRLLADAGLRTASPVQLLTGGAGAALLVLVLVAAVSRTIPLAIAFAVFTALAPRAWLRRRARLRITSRRDAWPDAVDHLVSGIRAGLSLPEALAALGASGPPDLRLAFARFAGHYQGSGAFATCLDELADDLADPVGDRVIEALRVAREVGGTDLGALLRTLSRFLREDARTRGEVEARQSWSVNAARVALAAPWLVLLLLATQSSTVEAYNSASGAMVLLVGGAVSYVAFVLMRRLGRLPVERRVHR